MSVLQGMSVDRMIIILPSALIAMYIIISFQKSLCSKDSPYPGLIIPILCFLVSTVLAVRPMIISEAGVYAGLGVYCLRMWLTFNIATVVFLFPYFVQRKRLREMKEYYEAHPEELIQPDRDDSESQSQK
ncbi:MAG: hypothetical protein Q4C80_05380 [Bacillota bacterium]|nr:hypothetical protein [Bacillota bacterium]